MKKSVSIIGTVNYDRILLPHGASTQGLGGILYNVFSLAPHLTDDESIMPIARMGAERQREVERFASPYPGLDLSHMIWGSEGTNETVLTYISADEREESLIERVPPLDWNDIAPAVQADWIMVNLISGKELTPELMNRLVSETNGKVILDLQSLTLTFGEKSERNYRNIPSWRDWLTGLTVVKGNEEEIRWMLGEGDRRNESPIEELLIQLLDAGPGVAIVTRGTEGHVIGWRARRLLRWASVPAIPLDPGAVVDTTGSGDAFTSGYLLGMFRGETPFKSSLLAASLAASACMCAGLAPLGDLTDPAAFREKAYTPLLKRIGSGWSGDKL